MLSHPIASAIGPRASRVLLEFCGDSPSDFVEGGGCLVEWRSSSEFGLVRVSTSDASYLEFKKQSQDIYSRDLAVAEGILIEDALLNCQEQFERLVPAGMISNNQLFFDVITSRRIGEVERLRPCSASCVQP